MAIAEQQGDHLQPEYLGAEHDPVPGLDGNRRALGAGETGVEAAVHGVGYTVAEQGGDGDHHGHE